MKEYRICMPLTVDEVSVFVFPTLTHTHTHKLPSYDCELIDKREFQFKCECVGSTCNLESVNALIRKVPTEHTDLLRRLCGSFGILGSEVRSATTGSANPVQAMHNTWPAVSWHSAVVSKLSAHLSASLSCA